MRVIEQLKDAVKWIYKDFKTDFIFLFNLFTGKEKPKLNLEGIKNFNLVNMLKECWTWYLLIFAALFCGMFLQAQDQATACNEYVQEKVMPALYEHYGVFPPGDKVFILDNVTYNLSKS